ncbi:hypothetical protein DRO61_06855, partial [Candidatus Bathyarchaeota archaeon]
MSRIVFSTIDDTVKVRFLSNSSNYPFVLEDKTWPTVDHYVYAKKFEGTQLENIIRESPTVFQAKKLATRCKYVFDIDPITGKKTKVKGYGQQYQYRIRNDWDFVEEEILRAGITAKFAGRSSLKKKLTETKTSTLIDSANPLTGPILESIRKDIQIRDLPYTEIDGKNKKMLSALIYLTIKISRLEGWDNVYKEMVGDAIYAFTGEETGQRILSIHQDYSQKREEKSMPKYKKVLNDIQKRIPTDVSFQAGSAEILTSFFAWKENFASSSDKYTLDKNLESVRTIKISLHPGRRWYRDQVPPKIEKKKKRKKKEKKKVVEKEVSVEDYQKDEMYYI